MSVYSDCSRAISELAERNDVFTEIDVVNEAASDSWGKTQFRDARKYANQIVSAKYRSGEVVRYGPVEYQGISDYARRAGMIVYGGAQNGPATWETPNGSMPQIARHADTLQISGRRKGTARHDEQDWTEQVANGAVPQGIKIGKPLSEPVAQAAPTPAGNSAEIVKLQEELAHAHARIAELEELVAAESSDQAPATDRVAAAPAAQDVRKLVEDLVLELTADFDTRLGKVESSMDRFNQFVGALAPTS